LEYAWTLALDQETGNMTVTMVDRDGVFVFFGSCTPLWRGWNKYAQNKIWFFTLAAFVSHFVNATFLRREWAV